ncbi:hypothetical protein CKO17_02960 [Marichromatium gracile]|nr:hypothetical protein [Marichromatium gracile]
MDRSQSQAVMRRLMRQLLDECFLISPVRHQMLAPVGQDQQHRSPTGLHASGDALDVMCLTQTLDQPLHIHLPALSALPKSRLKPGA